MSDFTKIPLNSDPENLLQKYQKAGIGTPADKAIPPAANWAFFRGFNIKNFAILNKDEKISSKY